MDLLIRASIAFLAAFALGCEGKPRGEWHMNGKEVQLPGDVRIDHWNSMLTVIGKGPTERCAAERKRVGLSVDTSATSLRWYENQAMGDCQFSRAHLQSDGTVRFDPLRP